MVSRPDVGTGFYGLSFLDKPAARDQCSHPDTQPKLPELSFSQAASSPEPAETSEATAGDPTVTRLLRSRWGADGPYAADVTARTVGTFGNRPRPLESRGQPRRYCRCAAGWIPLSTRRHSTNATALGPQPDAGSPLPAAGNPSPSPSGCSQHSHSARVGRLESVPSAPRWRRRSCPKATGVQRNTSPSSVYPPQTGDGDGVCRRPVEGDRLLEQTQPCAGGCPVPGPRAIRTTASRRRSHAATAARRSSPSTSVRTPSATIPASPALRSFCAPV